MSLTDVIGPKEVPREEVADAYGFLPSDYAAIEEHSRAHYVRSSSVTIANCYVSTLPDSSKNLAVIRRLTTRRATTSRCIVCYRKVTEKLPGNYRKVTAEFQNPMFFSFLDFGVTYRKCTKSAPSFIKCVYTSHPCSLSTKPSEHFGGQILAQVHYFH